DHEQVQAMGLRVQARNDAGQDIVMPGAFIGLSHTPPAIGTAAVSAPGITELRAGWDARRAAAGEPADPPRLPLSGLRVLGLGTIIAGPYVATLLGELGADVIKVERPPAGDEFRVAHGGRGGAGFSVYNRDQRSILIDLRSDHGQRVFRRLVQSSDVVVDNYRAGVPDRLGIGHAQLRDINPLITSVSVSAFGGVGPLGDRPGFDPVIQALSGIMRAQGGPVQSDSPAFLTVPVNDVLAAGLGALGACAALLARDRLGTGQQVSTTLCAASCLLQSAHLVACDGVRHAAVGGRDFAGPAPFDSLYQAADGWVRVGGVSADGDGELTTAIAGLTAADAVRRAAAAGLPAVRARRVPELTADDQLIGHGLLAVIDRDEAGVARVGPGRWLEMPGLTGRPPAEAPEAGEHGQAILAELGLAPVADAVPPTG
ncbi:MAG: CoA transferase, partial [Trebonia sp.]